MDAEYINLPRANAKDLSQSLKTSLEKRDRNYTKWWPNRSNSEFIKSENYNWHIQKFGSTGKSYCLFTEPAHLHIAGTL